MISENVSCIIKDQKTIWTWGADFSAHKRHLICLMGSNSKQIKSSVQLPRLVTFTHCPFLLWLEHLPSYNHHELLSFSSLLLCCVWTHEKFGPKVVEFTPGKVRVHFRPALSALIKLWSVCLESPLSLGSCDCVIKLWCGPNNLTLVCLKTLVSIGLDWTLVRFGNVNANRTRDWSKMQKVNRFGILGEYS